MRVVLQVVRRRGPHDFQLGPADGAGPRDKFPASVRKNPCFGWLGTRWRLLAEVELNPLIF